MNRRMFLKTVSAGVAGAAALSVLPALPQVRESWRLWVGRYANEQSLLWMGADRSCTTFEFMDLHSQARIVTHLLHMNPRAELLVLTEGFGWAMFDFLKNQPLIADRVRGVSRFVQKC